MRILTCSVLLLTALFLHACGSGGGSSPSDSSAHPPGWFATHAEDAAENPDYTGCTGCHGTDLSGSGDVVSCYSCHAFSTVPPFVIHPLNWSTAYNDHRAYAAANGFSSCAGCHGQDLRGRESVPGCFSASYNGQGCHADGPAQVSHPVDGSYLAGNQHGLDARADLTSCQSCHGEIGGPGSNPRFNIGFGDNACEDCHEENFAHPSSDWDSHSLAGNIQASCSLCHGVALDGVGGVGSSCLECHGVSPGLHPVGCSSCHNVPPDSADPVGDSSPNLSGAHGRNGHSLLISLLAEETCDRCHSGFGTGSDMHDDSTRPADLNLPFDPQDTIVPTSDGANTTCTGICHVERDAGPIDYPHNGESWY